MNKENHISTFLKQLFASLNEEKINYCILRNYEGLPEKVGNDIDIWVKEGQQNKFHEVLFETANGCGWNLIRRLSKSGFKCDTFIAKEDVPLKIIHIDCWWFFYWRNISFVNERAFRDHVDFLDKGFYIPSPGLEASVLLLQNLVYHGKVKEKYKSRISDFSKRDTDNFLKAIRKPFGESLAKSILAAAIEGKWEELEKKVNSLRWILFKRALFYKPIVQITHWAVYLYDHMKTFFPPSCGLFIVLIGPDGSGKTTTANKLIESEVKKLFQKKMYFHGHFPFLPELKKILAFFKKDNNKAAVLSPPENPGMISEPFGFFRSMIYPLYYGLDYFLGHILIWKERANGGLVIFDRYFYDYLIQRQYSTCPRWPLFLIAQFIPKPDVIIYLENKPEEIYRRKPELPVEEIERQAKICEEITNRFKNGVVIETFCSPKEVVEKIQRIIIKRIKEKQRVKT